MSQAKFNVLYKYTVEDVVKQILAKEFSYYEFLHSHDVYQNFTENDLDRIATLTNNWPRLLVA